MFIDLRNHSDISYGFRLAELEAMASDLLGMRFHDGSSNYQTHIGARFIWIDRMHLEGDHIGRDAEILKLLFLFKHLKELRDLHPDAYRRARRAVRKSPNEAQYFGARMEVYVAASLARAGIRFLCRESPDYELLDKHRDHFIECGSAHITGPNEDLVKKINLAVASKCKKQYAKRNTALFLDATNIMQRAAVASHPYSTDQLREAVREAIKDIGYGNVLLFSYGLNRDASGIAASYIRVDAPEIEPGLLQFIDAKYPFGPAPDPIGIALYPNQG